MLSIIVRAMLIAVLVDLIIGFMFVGVVLYGWLREAYNEAFPTGLEIINKYKRWLNAGKSNNR